MSLSAATMLAVRGGGHAPTRDTAALQIGSAMAVGTGGDDLATVSAMVGDLYDAAISPERWPGALAKVRDFVGGSAASIFAKDVSRKAFNVFYQCGGVDQHYVQLYFEKYVNDDPFTTAHVLAEIEQPISNTEIMPYQDIQQTRIYKEWARPQGIVDSVSAVLERSGTGAAICGIFRKEEHGLVDDDARWRMRQIVPHIRRAVLIGRVIELKTLAAAGFADTLDGLAAGMFLVDENGRIVHANVSGVTMLADATVLRAVSGKLTATDAAAALALANIFAAAGGGDAAVGTKGIAVPLPGRDGSCYAAHILPLTSGARRRAGAGYAAAAAVFVRKAEFEAPSAPEAIARHYKLTAAELRVMLAVVQVGGVPETAAVLGIAEGTVKTHLCRLFGKTGANRQADLVKIVAGFSSPLVA
jgi:DNA-binding CsgD family transcriptional regulator